MATPVQVNIALGILNRYHEREPESKTANLTYLAAENLIRNIISGHETIVAPPTPEAPAQAAPSNPFPAFESLFTGPQRPAVPAATENDQNSTDDEYVVTGLSLEEKDEVCKLLNTLRNQPPSLPAP